MVVTIPQSAALADPVRRVASSGVPVIVLNVGDGVYQQVGALSFVGQPEKTAGQEAGKQMSAANVRHALCVIHEKKNTALTDRCDGFKQEMTSAGASVDVLSVDGSQLHASQTAIEAALKKNPDIDGVLATGIIGFNASGGALQAMKAFGKIKLGSFDVSAADLKAVQNGQALFVIDQQPFLEGYDAVQVAAFQVRYGQHPFAPIYTGPSLITKSNAAKVAQLYKNTGIPLFRGGYPS
jgi:simple sugar transport system substrate-binding protein